MEWLALAAEKDLVGADSDCRHNRRDMNLHRKRRVQQRLQRHGGIPAALAKTAGIGLAFQAISRSGRRQKSAVAGAPLAVLVAGGTVVAVFLAAAIGHGGEVTAAVAIIVVFACRDEVTVVAVV